MEDRWRRSYKLLIGEKHEINTCRWLTQTSATLRYGGEKCYKQLSSSWVVIQHDNRYLNDLVDSFLNFNLPTAFPRGHWQKLLHLGKSYVIIIQGLHTTYMHLASSGKERLANLYINFTTFLLLLSMLEFWKRSCEEIQRKYRWQSMQFSLKNLNDCFHLVCIPWSIPLSYQWSNLRFEQ